MFEWDLPVLRRLRALVLCLALSAAMPGSAATVVLYDAALGTRPSAQGWTYLADPIFGAAARESFADGVALLDSRVAVSDKAGWFSNLPPFGRHPAQPSLDSERGFLISFIAQVLEETHRTEHRAGFSVIVTAANLSAIELGFWTDRVWAQSGPDFLQAESGALDAATAPIRYDLEVRGSRYRLSANGATVLSGDLRRYDSFGLPYQIPEFLFFGDDTTSAAGLAAVSRISAGDLPVLSVARDETAGWVLSTSAENGREVRFDHSEDLVTWVEVGRAVSGQGVAQVAIPTGATARFFRAVLQ
ncbi:MAG: hypothetical protein JNK85_20885 [Verrucomicrobiales bacterium]|nr:hypothetical protein [Verrucomicrobiales bacterium]